MFRGAGKIGLRTINSPKIMYAPRANTFRMTLETTEETAKAFPQNTCGARQTVDTIATEQTYKLFLGIESFDAEDIGFIMGEQIGVASTATLPEVVSLLLPATGSLAIANPDLVLDQIVSATVLDSLATNRVLTQVPNATPTLASGQFKVSAGSITFATAEAGRAINYMYDKNFTNLRSVGLVASPQVWGAVAFSGIVCGDRFPKPMRIFVPSMKATPKFDLSIGDKTTVELEFTMTAQPGYRLPFVIADL